MEENDITHAVEVTALKEGNAQDMRTRAKELTNDTDIDAKFVLERKSHLFYKGQGWVNDNPLELDKETKLKDKLSQKFIAIKNVIEHFNKTNDLDKLTEYFEALDACGIHITVDEPQEGYVLDSKQGNLTIKNMLDELNEYQKIIDNIDIELDAMAQKANDEDYAPKSKFKSLMKLLYKKQIGKDITKQIDKERKNIDLTSERLVDIEK